MIIALRSLIFYAGFSLWTIVWSFVVLASAPLPKAFSYWLCAVWGRASMLWLSLTCGVRYRVMGRENLPPPPYVILSNHQSAWETIAYLNVFPRYSYVFKQELLRLPFFGWAMRLTWPISVDRKAGREAVKKVLTEGEIRLRAGLPVLIFPEGTRQTPGHLGRFASTGAGLAVKTGLPVVPVAHNAGLYWPRGNWRKLPGIITLHIGEPIASAGKTATALNQEAHAWIAAQLTDTHRIQPKSETRSAYT